MDTASQIRVVHLPVIVQCPRSSFMRDLLANVLAAGLVYILFFRSDGNERTARRG